MLSSGVPLASAASPAPAGWKEQRGRGAAWKPKNKGLGPAHRPWAAGAAEAVKEAREAAAAAKARVKDFYHREKESMADTKAKKQAELAAVGAARLKAAPS